MRYIEEQGIYVSTMKENCSQNTTMKVTDLEKSQANDTLTLDVYYTVYKNNQESDKRHDRLYFKINQDGTYYFYSSVMISKNIK